MSQPAAPDTTTPAPPSGRRIRTLLLVVVALLATAAVVGAATLTADDTPPQSEYAAVAERAVDEVAGGALLLDVRTQEEWDGGRAADAVLLPLAQIEAGALPDAARDRPIRVYCRSGRRAAIAVEILRKAGFQDVVNIGGFDDWQAAGGPIAS